VQLIQMNVPLMEQLGPIRKSWEEATAILKLRFKTPMDFCLNPKKIKRHRDI
jgi:hypothetical protein